MPDARPTGELDARFSSEGATATPWEEARDRVAGADVYWLSTVRPNGGPHVTPLLSVWLDGAAHFCTGPDEQKARNMARSPRCALIAGSDAPDGLDVVIEGEAMPVTDEARLRRLADAWVAKYGEGWRFDVRDGAFFSHAGGSALVFEVAAATAFAFARGDVYSQTRWRFDRG
jgi:nitroimidazol reductase NimA-like FMN-containing flavoprotein (pyridoxamine 5'-phosphate oxidase superfamily)